MQLLTLAGSLFLVICSVAARSVELVGPCTKARQDAGESMPGKYLPQCTEFGFYNPVQCHGSSGKCWCVVPDTGKTVEGSSVMRAQPECSTCHIQRAKLLHPAGLVGNYVPECTDDGLFASEQHWGSVGQKWCVNPKTGEEIQGTHTGPGDVKKIDCEKQAQTQQATDEQGPCYAKMMEESSQSGRLGSYKPTCTANGYFRTEQGHGSTGYTWCVNPKTGDEIPNTRRGPGRERARCGACFKEIEELLTRKLTMGQRLAECNEENGDYKPVQHHEGYTWCANPQTGAVEGKKYPPGDKTPLPCVNN